MKITKRRINKVNSIMELIGEDEIFISAETNDINLLEKVGFSQIEIGKSIIPKVIGSTSKFNVNGKEVIAIPKEKEIVVYTMPYNIVDWHGNPHSGYYDRPIERWKRVFIPAPEVKISIVNINDGVYVLRTSQFFTKNDPADSLKHTINLMLELFGTVEIRKKDNNPLVDTKTVSWEILPPGETPWESFYEGVKQKIRNYSDNEVLLVKERYDFLKSLNPSNIISGKNGFQGYFIAELSCGLYICDSIFIGNAMYFFDQDWEQLSQLTKQEIINDELALKRLIHRGDWKKQVLLEIRKYSK